MPRIVVAAILAVTASFSAAVDIPACYVDLVACGLTTVPRTADDASLIVEDVTGCMFYKYATKAISAECMAEVDAVGISFDFITMIVELHS